MKPTYLRSPLVLLAVGIALGCALLPGRFVVAGAGQSQSTTQRRGKNGQPDNQSSDANQSDNSSGQQQDGSGADSVNAGRQSSGSKSNSGSGAADKSQSDSTIAQPPKTAASPTNRSGRQADRPNNDPLGSRTSRSTTEAPPFDRPPVRANQGGQGGASQSPRRSQDSYGDASSSNSRGYGQRQGGYSQSQAEPSQSQGGYSQPRSSSGPPVLNRSPDLEPSQSGGQNPNRRPPVLSRPGDDSQDQPEQSGQAPQRSGDYRGSQGSQQQGPSGQGGQGGNGDQPIKLESTLVDVDAVVSDRSGRFIPRLTKNDFEVYEDGVKQQIATFSDTEVPFNVALLLDVSPSVSNSVRDIQEAAEAFVDELRPEDRVMVVSFDEHVHFLTDFTNDRRELTYAIRNTRIGNGTSVYEAVYDTIVNRMRYVQGRKAMILLSDGEDTTSRSVGYQETISTVQESGVLVYGLRYPDTGGYGPSNSRSPRIQMPFPLPGSRFPFPFPWPGHGNGPWDHFDTADDGGMFNWNGGQWGRHRGRNYNGDFMRDVTDAGGGPVYDAKAVGDMSRLARQIADELRQVYRIGYYPTNPTDKGGYRAIRVNVVGRDDLAVRHRRGYYADSVRQTT